MFRLLYILQKILAWIVRHVRLYSFQYSWRKENEHNKTVVENVFPINNVKVGKCTYGPIIVYCWGTEGEGLKIGDFCSIASGVKFILGGNHRMNFISTFPFRNMLSEAKEAYSNGCIEIKDDVWIGSDVTILSGVTLGQGCVVAAGSVVTRSFPEYSIIGGIPAKILSRRFDDNTIQRLQEIKFSRLNTEKIRLSLDDLYKDVNEISEDELEDLIKRINEI